MLSAKKARQRTLIVSGGDRILSDIEKLLIFTIVKMRFGCLRSEVKYQPKVDQCSLGAHSVPKDGGRGRPSGLSSSPAKVEVEERQVGAVLANLLGLSVELTKDSGNDRCAR